MRALNASALAGPQRRRHCVMNNSTFCLLGFLLLATVADAANCKKGCSQSDTGFLKYQPGNVYDYSFDSIMTVGVGASAIEGGESDDTSLKVVGTAKLFAEGNCGYTLQLNAVKVSSTKESLEKKITQSIQKPVHFNMADGLVEPEICADAADSVYALNVKRAIISLLQSNPEAKSEVDVFGQCSTHSSVTKLGNTEVIAKVRNLNKCGYREQISSGILSGQVNERAGIKSSHLLQADYSKELKLQAGVISSVYLVEEYKFAAGIGKAAGAGAQVRAKVITNLKLKNAAGVAAAAPAVPGTNVATSIIFQKPETYTNKNIVALKNALTEVVQQIDGYVKKGSANSFVELIRLMRSADAETLLELAAVPNPNKVLARKVYLDALFRTGSAESARAILKQLNKMEDKEKALAILSLNLVQVVDKDTLQQAANLLNANAPKEVYLAVGRLVGKYCQQSGNDCAGADVTAISKKFIDNLKHCKANTKKDEDRILYVLKGIENTQQVAAGVAAVALTECIAAGHSTRVRVSALQAYASAASCEPMLQQKALELLRDSNEDSELRIEAYLAAVSCANAQLANDIAEIVNSETVNQVGGFIASHLRTIRDSTDATREQQRVYLSNVRVTKQFPKDYRRYSFNNELSYKLDALGASASADYKLLYSQHGFLPRSARLNISTEIFGNNYNVLDASIRQENIENVLEYYVGPKGLLNKDFDEIMKVIEVGDGGGGGGGPRARRSIADDTVKLAKKYKTYGSKPEHDVNLDLSLKLFGSELMFLSLGDNIPSSLDEVIRFFSTALERVKRELSAFNKEFIVHNLFLDTKLAYPTGVGIPLELSAQGFAANKFEVAISVDVDAVLEQNWQRAQYRLKVVPSVDVQLQLQLGFNAYVLGTGMRLVSNAHSATGSDITLSFINDGNGFNIAADLPREKLELINLQVNTDFFVSEQDKNVRGVALKSFKKRKPEQTEMCFNQLEMFGFNFCFESTDVLKTKAAVDGKQIGEDALLAGGPYHFALYMTSEKKLNFKFYHIPQTATGTQQWKLDFSTPQSKQPHDNSLGLELGIKPRSFVRLTSDSNQNRLAIEAGLNNDQKELVLYAQYEHNNDVKRNKIGFVKNGNEYKPVIEVQDKSGGVINDINGYRADGKVVVQRTGDRQTRYNFENFQVVNKENERLMLNGWVDVGPASLSSELHVQPGQQTYLLKSNIKLDNGEYRLGAFINNERTPQNVYGASAYAKAAEGDVNLELLLKVRQWELSTDGSLQYVRQADGDAISSSKFKHAISLKNQQQLVSSLEVSGSTEGKHKVEVQAELQRAKKLAALTVKYNSHQRAAQDYILELNAKYNKHSVDLLAKCDVASGNRLLIDNVLTTSWGTSLTAKGELGQRYTAQDVHIDLQGTAQFSGKDKPTQWMLKVLGELETTQSEFKLDRGNDNIITFKGDTVHPQDKVVAANLNLVVKEVLVAKANLKMAKNGKGELIASVETKKTEPTHKLEVQSKFHVQAPKFDVETTVKLDGEASKGLYLKTENTLDKQKFSSKNVAELVGKKFSFDASGSIKGELRNGELQGNFVYNGPTGRVIDGSINRKTSTNAKSGLSQGTMDVQWNHQADGKKCTVAFNGKLDKYDAKQKILAGDWHLVIDSDGQQLDATYHIKHLPKGQQNKMLDVGLSLKGNVLSVPLIQVGVVVDEYSVQHCKYHVSGKYGENLSADFKGAYNAGERAQTPSSFELTGNVQAPQSGFKTFEVNANAKYLKPNTDAAAAYLLEVHIDEKLGAESFIRIDAAVKGSRTQGSYSVNVETNRMQGPARVEGQYQREQSGSMQDGNIQGKQMHNLNYNYADKYVKASSELSYSGTGNVNLHYTLDSSYESAKSIDVLVQGQKLEEDGYSVSVQAQANGKPYKIQSTLYRAAHKKGIDVQAQLPAGQPIVLIGILELLDAHKAKVQLTLANIGGLDLQATAESAYRSQDDFYIVAEWSSAKLNLQGYHLEARTQANNINISLKNAQGVIFSGTASYSLKHEKNKSTIDGQGQLQYKGKAQQTNFKLIRQVYDLQTDKEVGFSYTFNGNFGTRNGVSTLKITNKDFNVKLSVCEEKKQCTNVQLQSTVTADGEQLDAVQHALLVLVDLRELGYPYEFELQSKSIKQGFKYQYSLNSNIITGNNMKYQLIAAVQPSGSKLQIKLPRREVLLETKQQVPEAGKIFGRYEQSISFYFDKTNKPQELTRLIASADVSGVERVALNVKGGARLEHPTLRTLSITGKLDANRDERQVNTELVLDVFRLPEQQLVANSRWQNIARGGHGFNVTSNQVVRSSGLGLQYEFNGHAALNTENLEFSAGADVYSGTSDLKGSAYLYGSKDRFEVLVHGLNEQLLQLVGEFDRQRLVSKFDTKLQLFAEKPLQVNTEVQPTLLKLAIKRDGLMDATGDLQLGKELKFNVLGAGKQLFNGRVALNSANFFQTTYTSNADDVKAYLNTVEGVIKQENEAARAKLRARFENLRQIIDKQIQLGKNSSPDFTQLKDNYESNVNEIVKELEADPALKELSESYHEIYTKVTKLVSDIAKTSAESFEKLHKSFLELYEKWEVILKDTVLPAWEELSVVASKLLGELRVEVINLYTKAFQSIMATLEQYGPALKNYGKAVNEALKPFSEAAQELFTVLSQASEDVLNELKDYLGKLPTFEELRADIQEQLQKLKVLERTLEFVNNLFDQLHILPQTPETRAFLEEAKKYIDSKLREQPTNDEHTLQQLMKLLAKAVRSIWISWGAPEQAVGAAAGLPTNALSQFISGLPHSTDIFHAPALLSLRISMLNFLLNEDWDALFSRDRLKSWILFNDFTLRAHVADGHQFITFDGQHLDFPGSCKYVLAQDSVDNNFTVVAQLNQGKLKSIMLVERDGDFIEITDASVLKLNGQPVEYPQHIAGGLHAWRRYYTIWVRSEYGVEIMCTADMKVCHLTVNGFYTSKTRGLFGNGNAEPYDDFLQVDGTIAANYASFGNGYGLGKCQPVANTAAENAKHEETCNDIFGFESPLALGYLFLDVSPYRKACDAAVAGAADKEAAACTVATAYGSALRLQQAHVMLPSRCLKCAGPQARDLGQEFTQKIPNKQADIVFVVDLAVSPAVLANLVAPTITEVRETLKARGFTDVHVAVIAYNESLKYPALLTSDNGKLNYHGNLAELQLSGPKRFGIALLDQVVVDQKLIDIYEIFERIVKSIVPQSDELAFRTALSYPFRAGAAKSIIGVRSKAMDHTSFLKLLRTRIAGVINYADASIMHMIAPVNELALEGVPTEKIVGFNSRLVATLDGKDAKKRAKVQFENDLAIDYVLDNGGWIFATQNFDSLKAPEQKKALSQVTNTIADTLFKTEIVSECKCGLEYGLHAKHVCSIKSSNFVPNKKVKAAA